MNTYGLDRSLTPKGTFAPSAWELDNSRKLIEGEVRISLDKVHVEGTSFRQICQEAGNEEESIKENGNCFTLSLSKGESITLEFTK